MKTTYYLVAAAAVAVAGATIYARLSGDDPAALAGQAKAEAPRDVPRLALPPVSLPPDAPEPAEPAPLPVVAAPREVLPMPREVKRPAPVELVAASDPPAPAIPAVPAVPPEVTAPPSLPPLPKSDDSQPPPVPPAKSPVVPPGKLPAIPTVMPPAPAPNPAPAVTTQQTPAPAKPAPAAVLQPPVVPAPKPLPPIQSEPLPRVATEPVTGDAKFVVLSDDKLIEGGVRVEGDTVFVRQGALDRPFHKGKVQFVASSKDEVLKFMLAKVPAGDAAARLKVARWCMFSGLREQALAEAREVQKLQPSSAAAADMVRSLELSLKQFPPADAPTMGTPEPPGVVAELRAPVRPVSPTADPEPDVTPEAALVFGSRVQPFLANQCVECHAKPDHAGAFRLVRVAAADAGPQATRANLRATAAQLKKDDPAASPLLAKSLAAHGGMKQPAIATRQSAAYLALEAWVALAVGQPAPAPVVAAPAPAKPEPVAGPLPVPAAEPTPPAPVAVPVPVPVPNPAAVLPLPPVPPAPETPVVVPPVPAAPLALPRVMPANPNPPPAEVIPVVPPVPPVAKPPVPAIPTIPAEESKPKPLPIPAADAGAKKPSGLAPAGGAKFGEAIPPKPPVTGPSGDEFDPGAFNQPGK